MVNLRRPISRRAATRDNQTRNNEHQQFQLFGSPGNSSRSIRPPKNPKKTIVKPLNIDSRDDVIVSRRNSSQREISGDNDGYASDGSVNTLSGRPYRNNDPVTVVTVSLKQALKLQRTKLGDDHPSVTKAIHSLALEYKTQGKLGKSVRLLEEGITILDSRLSKLMKQNETQLRDDASQCSVEETRISAVNEADARKVEIMQILEEKSTAYSCLGNIYRMRRLYREAMDYYVKSCDMLVEAGYSGESKRVSMLIRIMRRTEIERTKKPAVRKNVPKIQRISLEELGYL